MYIMSYDDDNSLKIYFHILTLPHTSFDKLKFSQLTTNYVTVSSFMKI